MMAADPRAALAPEDRTWIAERLQVVTAAGQYVPFAEAERALVQEPLLAYVREHHPRVLDMVARQFRGDGAEEGPQGMPPQRPSAHYGLVPERRQG
jgi:hypothetical protein